MPGTRVSEAEPGCAVANHPAPALSIARPLRTLPSPAPSDALGAGSISPENVATRAASKRTALPALPLLTQRLPEPSKATPAGDTSPEVGPLRIAMGSGFDAPSASFAKTTMLAGLCVATKRLPAPSNARLRGDAATPIGVFFFGVP